MGDASPLVRDPRYRSLDLWRGLACLMVVVHHAGFIVDGRDLSPLTNDHAWRALAVGFFKRMELGVPLFFVISGYCIAASADLTRRKGLSPWTFLVRRVRRIYPPYWAALALFVVFCGSLDLAGLSRFHKGDHALELASPGELNLSQWVGNLTLTESWRPHVWGSYESIYTRIAWSLCYEEQFYALCFLALLIAPKRLYAILTTATALILLIRVAAWDSGGIGGLSGTFVIFWHQFALGLAVYYRLNVAATPLARRIGEIVPIGLFGVAAATGDTSSAVASAFALILIALRLWEDRASPASGETNERPERRTPFWIRGLHACGVRCYSIYLAHLPVCVAGNLLMYEWGFRSFWSRVWVVAPTVSCVAVAFCFGFFEVVERRFLNPPARPARQTSD